MVQLSLLYMTTGKIIALIIWTLISKVMSLLLNVLSRLHSSPSRKQGSFNFMAAVTVNSDFETQENKICHCFHFFLDPTNCLLYNLVQITKLIKSLVP